MKKIILLLTVTVLTLHACSSDDDSTTQMDSFIGVWTQSELVLNGNEQPIDDCDMQSNFTINSDGTFVEYSYFTDTDGNCELDFADAGTWENLGNNTYRLSYSPDLDGDTYEEEITISDNSFSVLYDAPYIYVFVKS